MAKSNIYRRQYNQQMSRLRRIIREAEKKGIMFPESALPKAIKNPTAKTIERLRSITPTKLRSKGFILNEDTGELLRATPRRQKQLRAQIRAEQQITKLAESQETSDDIISAFNVKSPADLPEEAHEIWFKKYQDELESRLLTDEEFVDDIEDITKTYDTLYADEDEETSWRDNVDWDTGLIKDKPISEEEVAFEVLTDILSSGKNSNLLSTLQRILNDEIDYLDMRYGEGSGRSIVIDRFKDSPSDVRALADKAASGYQEEAIDNSVALVTIIRGGNISNSDLMDIESAANEIPKGNKYTKGRFRK